MLRVLLLLGLGCEGFVRGSGALNLDAGTSSEDVKSHDAAPDSGGDPKIREDAGDDPEITTDCGDTLPVWDASWAALEEEVLELINQQRALGADCRSEGDFAPARALSMEQALRCASRAHSRDMGTNNFFDHTGSDGSDSFERMLDQWDYAGQGPWGENIAAGYNTAREAVEGWMSSDGHCSNIMGPDYLEIGVGYFFDANSEFGSYWTTDFGGG